MACAKVNFKVLMESCKHLDRLQENMYDILEGTNQKLPRESDKLNYIILKKLFNDK